MSATKTSEPIDLVGCLEMLRGERLFITGHTGFKGSWLLHLLRLADVSVHGFALEPVTQPNIFQSTGIADDVSSTIADIAHRERLVSVVNEARPSVIFHLAAQPLVLESWRHPSTTFETNVQGTVNLLEAARSVDSVRAVVVVTTDKCYEPRKFPGAHREDDPLGGLDPYSASKACAELVVGAYRPLLAERGIAVATARAGNVIGGGDWSPNRLVPDCVRAARDHSTVELRMPGAVRPWQHVLEPLAGYVELAARMLKGGSGTFDTSWNFGPSDIDHVPVARIAKMILAGLGGGQIYDIEEPTSHGETGFLALDTNKARGALSWRPVLDLERTVDWTVDWYRAALAADEHLGELTMTQVRRYVEEASN